MNSNRIPQFGDRLPGRHYPERPSVYGLAFDGHGRLLVVHVAWKDQTILPGGGIDDGESPEEALIREVEEETGYRSHGLRELCRANEYVVTKARGRTVNKLGIFYRIELSAEPGPALEDDHEVDWLTPGAALAALAWESHRWALERALE